MANAKNANPIKGTIERVPSLPTHVVIYKIPASPFWWTRCYTPDKRYVIRSTKTTGKRDAQAFARQLFHDSLTASANNPTVDPKTLRAVANSLLSQEKASAKKSLYDKDRTMLHNVILPHFGNTFLKDIGHQELNEFLSTLRDRNLAPATKRHYMGLIGKVFNHGIQIGAITAKPLFPKLGEKLQTTEKRDYLTVGEYQQLSKTILKMERDGIKFRGTQITTEHKLLGNFMINSFIRPSDLRVLKHKHIRRMHDRARKTHWLVLEHPGTKTTSDPVHTMPKAVDFYDELIKFRKEEFRKGRTASEYLNPDDYLFMPEFANRDTAIKKLGKIFSLIFKTSGLPETTGKRLSMYSFRHTALMYRLIKSDVDTLTLAKNARTSQEVLAKFYASHLTTDQARVKLHSFSDARSETRPKASARRKPAKTDS